MLGVRRLLYTSSATVLLDPEKKIQLDMDETTPYPTKHPDVYTTTKEAAERIVLAANSNQLATCVVRPSIVFGVGDKVIEGEVVLPLLIVVGLLRYLRGWQKYTIHWRRNAFIGLGSYTGVTCCVF